MIDLALLHAGELVTCAGAGKEADQKLGIIEDGALLAEGGKITWVGTTRDLRRRAYGKPRLSIDAGGSLVTPGFVDPHTHLVFAGSREDELDKKISGETYVSILNKGGGIARTTRDTNDASVAEIARQSGERLRQLLQNGVTTAEVKTGYGQSLAGEVKMLDAISRLKRGSRVELVTTFLGLHSKPAGSNGNSSYVDSVVRKVLPEVAKMRDRPRFSDCFCEEGVFSREECRRYLKASGGLGFALKIHADEFSRSGGASLAAELGCVSADHLGRSAPDDVEAMTLRGVVAVLLPGTSYYSSIPYADARGILRTGCQVALGTDLSPNSWIESPQLVMSLACNAMRMTPAEAILGFTRSAAHAIARSDIGSLTVGSSADLVVHSITGYRFVPYRVGGRYVRRVIKRGELVYVAADS